MRASKLKIKLTPKCQSDCDQLEMQMPVSRGVFSNAAHVESEV